MKIKKLLYFIPVTMLFLTSCAVSKSAYTVSGEWSVTNINGKSITPNDETPFLGFDTSKGRIYGFTGCNRLTGEVNLKNFANGKPNFANLGMTQMLCPDDTYEREFMEALDKVKSLEVKDNNMLLKNAEGKVIVTLKKK